MYVPRQSGGANTAGDPLRLSKNGAWASGMVANAFLIHHVCFALDNLQSAQIVSLHRFFILWFPNLFDLYTP